MLTHPIMIAFPKPSRFTKSSIFPIYVTSYLIKLMKVTLKFVHKAGVKHFKAVFGKFSFHDGI